MLRKTLGGAFALVTLVGLTGCGFGGPKPDPVATSVAAALAHHDVRRVAFAGPDAKQAQAQLASTLGGLADLRSTVTAGAIKTNGDAATATLTWTWKTGTRTWTTHAPMALTKADNTWRVVWKPSLVYPGLDAERTLGVTTLTAPRGPILGAGDAPIVRPRAVDRYGIDKAHVSGAQAVAAAHRLAALVRIDPTAYAKQVRKAGPKAYVEAITIRTGSPDAPDRTEVDAIKGALVVRTTLPLAPSRTFASAILGTVGQPTAEMVKKSNGTLSAGDQVGLGGLQARYDARLGGTPGIRVDLVDASGSGNPTRKQLFSAPPVAGTALHTTLSIPAQSLAERALAGTTTPAALVAIQPSTGNILAAASGPASNGYNTATFAQYAPGSTFKIVSSLALLRSGVTPTTIVDCPPTVTVDGKQFKNYSDYPPSEIGRIPFRSAIANSCNTAVIGQRHRLGTTTLGDAAAALGLGVDHEVGFPAYFGSVPPAGSATEAAADMIGQGKVQASPLTMATVAASVKQGAAVVPRLLTDLTPVAATPSVPLTAKEAAQLRSLMRAVVTEGSGRVLLGLPGPPVLAKTGTAEYGSKLPLRTHAWMIAVHGDLAVAVFVEDGQSGSGTAGPILKQFLLGMH